VSAKIGRHFWRHPAVPLGAEQWERLPARFGFDPPREAEWRDLAAAVRRAVDTELTPRQREVFVAIVVNGVPLDTLVLSLGSSRNAIYKVMFDARRKLPGVSYGPFLPLTGICPMTLRGTHERLVGA
jgi:RNA polymerase sigma-70 factor (ECF subfamily)